jgi:Fe-S-cluster-containing dehydrogenase component
LKKRWVLVFDQERCIGCEACTVACRVENDGKTRWIRVETQGGGKKDTPAGQFPSLDMQFLPVPCQHCARPPCVDQCPSGALEKHDDGAVIVNRDLCDGCGLCVEVCPYEALGQSEVGGPVEKCTLCLHRLQEGLEPFCVVCCEGQTIFFGDANDRESEVSRIISGDHAFQLEPSADTGPSVYYIRPRPPRGL